MRKRIFGALLSAVIGLSMTVNASAASLAVAEEDLPAACSSGWGYKDMELRSSTEGRQQLYDRLMEVYSELWFSNEDLQLDDYLQSYVAAEINITEYGLSPTEATEVYYTFRMDNPLFYFVSNRQVTMSMSYGSRVTYYLCLVVDEDYVSASARKDCQQQIIDYIAEKAEGAASLSSRYEIAKYFHDEICRDAEYAYVYKGSLRYADTSIRSHNIIGIITEGRGVCESYAKIYQMLLSYAGISNTLVVGDAGGSHAWNIVRMDNDKYYNFDVTWDDMTKIRYTYFARGAEFFDTEHTPNAAGSTGKDFIYALPKVPDEDYDPSDVAAGLFGDINDDDVTNMRDLAVLQRYLIGFFERVDEAACDVNGDGILNMKDLVCLQRYINGYTQ